jgi:uncharacterized Zn-finger protein
MDSHIKKIHQNTEKTKFICEICSNSFSSAPNLKQHVKTVHESEVSRFVIIIIILFFVCESVYCPKISHVHITIINVSLFRSFIIEGIRVPDM